MKCLQICKLSLYPFYSLKETEYTSKKFLICLSMVCVLMEGWFDVIGKTNVLSCTPDLKIIRLLPS